MNRILTATILAFAACSVSHAAEPAYPSKPVRLLVGFSPGGGTDVAARIVAKKVSEDWNQQVVVDNRAGAGGLIAIELVAKANPDGYTLLVASPSFAIQPGISAHLSYDPIRDFAPITVASSSPYVLVLYPGVPAKSVKELIALAKAKPGTLNYASSGIGGAQHFTTELFALMAGIQIVHVAYKGAINVPDVIAGRVQMLFSGVPQALPHLQAGRLRAIGVTTPKRSRALPEVPTIAEAGVPGYDVTVWYGLFATGRTPKPVIDKINASFVKAIHSADVGRQLNAMGLDPVGNPSAEFAKAIKEEIARWTDVAKRAGIRAQ